MRPHSVTVALAHAVLLSCTTVCLVCCGVVIPSRSASCHELTLACPSDVVCFCGKQLALQAAVRAAVTLLQSGPRSAKANGSDLQDPRFVQCEIYLCRCGHTPADCDHRIHRLSEFLTPAAMAALASVEASLVQLPIAVVVVWLGEDILL